MNVIPSGQAFSRNSLAFIRLPGWKPRLRLHFTYTRLSPSAVRTNTTVFPSLSPLPSIQTALGSHAVRRCHSAIINVINNPGLSPTHYLFSKARTALLRPAFFLKEAECLVRGEGALRPPYTLWSLVPLYLI